MIFTLLREFERLSFRRNLLAKTAPLFLTVAMASGIATPPRAEAYLIKLLSEETAEASVPAAIFCSFPFVVLTLPFCIFGENTSGNAVLAPYSKNDLIENGYTEPEADLILSDLEQFTNILKKNDQVFTTTPNETQVTLAEGIRKIDPNASDTFITFVVDRLNLP